MHADYILEGSLLRAGQELRINAQLVRASDDAPVWSRKFESELTNIVAVEDDISRGIVNSLRLRLGRGRRRYESDAEAYDLYLTKCDNLRNSARQLLESLATGHNCKKPKTVSAARFDPSSLSSP